jgi:hypothetical protein
MLISRDSRKQLRIKPDVAAFSWIRMEGADGWQINIRIHKGLDLFSHRYDMIYSEYLFNRFAFRMITFRSCERV